MSEEYSKEAFEAMIAQHVTARMRRQVEILDYVCLRAIMAGCGITARTDRMGKVLTYAVDPDVPKFEIHYLIDESPRGPSPTHVIIDEIGDMQ